jgi:hypothetical protein
MAMRAVKILPNDTFGASVQPFQCLVLHAGSSAGLELTSVYVDHQFGRTRQDRLAIWADRIEDQ